MREAIDEAVRSAIEALVETFQARPTLFYTEHDLVSWFAADLNARLAELVEATDRDGLPHRLVHAEYPTPTRFKVMSFADVLHRVIAWWKHDR